jgi:hypothetical protein
MTNHSMFFLIITLCFLSSCNKTEDEKQINIESYRNDISRLNFSSVNPLYPDKQILVFNKLGGNSDTSWSISVFKISDSSIQVNLNEITPKIIAENFSIKQDSLNFSNFNGYRCILPLAYWNMLIKNIGLDTYKLKNPKRREVLHGTMYSLYYNSEAFVDSEEDFLFLKKADSLFSKYIISKINFRAAHTPSQYDDGVKR